MIAELFKRTQHLMMQNSTALLTSVGVAGTVTTAVLTGRASFKAAKEITKAELTLRMDTTTPQEECYLENREKIALVWPEFIPPVGVGAMTIASIILAHRLSAKEAAALATAYGVSERAFTEYREKVVERIGPNKETAVRDAIAQDRVNNTDSKGVILLGTGTVLCMDLLTGRYFESTVETIKKAENNVNFEIVSGMYASASSFYDELGLEATEMTDLLGWNIDNKLEIVFSHGMTLDGRPYVTISPTPPVPHYNKLY